MQSFLYYLNKMRRFFSSVKSISLNNWVISLDEIHTSTTIYNTHILILFSYLLFCVQFAAKIKRDKVIESFLSFFFPFCFFSLDFSQSFTANTICETMMTAIHVKKFIQKSQITKLFMN